MSKTLCTITLDADLYQGVVSEAMLRRGKFQDVVAQAIREHLERSQAHREASECNCDGKCRCPRPGEGAK